MLAVREVGGYPLIARQLAPAEMESKRVRPLILPTSYVHRDNILRVAKDPGTKPIAGQNSHEFERGPYEPS